MTGVVHPFYEQHRGTMEAVMRRRLDLAQGMLRERAGLSDLDRVDREVMDEFGVVLTQMPYVGGAASRIFSRASAPSPSSAASATTRWMRTIPIAWCRAATAASPGSR